MKSIIDYTNKLKDFFAQKQALSDEVKTRAALGAHNLAKNYYGSQTNYGAVFTVNDDDSIHAVYSGTEHDAIECYMTKRQDKNYFLPNGKYIASIGTDNTDRNSFFGVGITKNGAWKRLAAASGTDQIEFTIDGDDFSNDGAYVSLYILFYVGYAPADRTFYPMICRADDADPNYSKPEMTNRELTAYAQNQLVNGCVNMCPNLAKTEVKNTVNFTVNDDGSVLVNGTNSSDSELITKPIIWREAQYAPLDLLVGKKFIVYGSPFDSTASNCYINFYYYDGTHHNIGISGSNPVEIDWTNVSLSNITYNLSIIVGVGKTVSNLLFKPMIIVGTLEAYGGVLPSFVPYSKPNSRLGIKKKTVTGTTSANGNISTGLSPRMNVVLGAFCTSPSYIGCVPMMWGNDTWGIHCYNYNTSGGPGLASESVSLDVYYFEL